MSAAILNDFYAMTRAVNWPQLISLLDGFDDKQETFDPFVPQSRLEAWMEGFRTRGETKAWKDGNLVPLRVFVATHWAPDLPERPLLVTRVLWYERRFSFLKLAVLLLCMERFNWRLFAGNETSNPVLDDVPQALARFCGEAVELGMTGWNQLRGEMREHHLDVCRRGMLLIKYNYTCDGKE